MLRKGFLGLISDWTASILEKHPRDLATAMETFGMESLFRRVDSAEDLGMLFSEWTVFDHQSPAQESQRQDTAPGISRTET